MRGHAANGLVVESGHRWTHLRINEHPDGGLARLRLHGRLTDAGAAAPTARTARAAGTAG
ncbi:hypothetical protein [Streptomyces sp. H34-S4]|uniref:hypothetical protein n=1 Tax=Streptomyces sp. H34-S4 TaxID=2996463 RepID=UPI002D1E3BE1|nr:hypothetical protein [Streptomyces sp. H34-S4]